MIVINAKLDGENTYDITVSETAQYRVSAFTLEDAIDRVADYIESHDDKFCFTKDRLEYAAKYSGYDVKQFAKIHSLKQCGTNGIYLEITSAKGCPNG
jgi:hypothetical protein